MGTLYYQVIDFIPILSTPLLVSLGKATWDILETFLAGSVEFYSKLPSVVESKLSFTVSDLVNNQVQFSSKTHCRKVGFFLSGL